MVGGGGGDGEGDDDVSDGKQEQGGTGGTPSLFHVVFYTLHLRPGSMKQVRPSIVKLGHRAVGAMLRCATWLAASSLLACFACIAACGWLDQQVYADEAGLLAGFSAPTFSAANVSRLPRWPPADPPSAQQQWLVDRLDERDLLPEVHALRHSAGCSCAAVSAVVHAGRGDGREAVLLSTRFGGSAAAGEARSAATLVELGAQLATASWLSRDVALLFVPCCACALSSAEASALARTLTLGLALSLS